MTDPANNAAQARFSAFSPSTSRTCPSRARGHPSSSSHRNKNPQVGADVKVERARWARTSTRSSCRSRRPRAAAKRPSSSSSASMPACSQVSGLAAGASRAVPDDRVPAACCSRSRATSWRTPRARAASRRCSSSPSIRRALPQAPGRAHRRAGTFGHRADVEDHPAELISSARPAFEFRGAWRRGRRLPPRWGRAGAARAPAPWAAWRRWIRSARRFRFCSKQPACRPPISSR